MRCEICHKDIGGIIVSLPIKQPDGRLSILACLKCAKQSSVYCQKHHQPHLGFADDDSTACLFCLEELVTVKKKEEAVIFDKILAALPKKEKKQLEEWASSVYVATGEWEARCVLKAIATKALRLKKTVEQVVEQIIKEKSVELILPERFF